MFYFIFFNIFLTKKGFIFFFLMDLLTVRFVTTMNNNTSITRITMEHITTFMQAGVMGSAHFTMHTFYLDLQKNMARYVASHYFQPMKFSNLLTL